MEIKNSFEVPLAPSEAWAVLMDIPRIVPCMPGAELEEKVDDRTYKGKVNVKLGPIGLAFRGTAQFEHMDPVQHIASVKAIGSDTKGRGGASATVNFALSPSAAGTLVSVVTDLTMSGSVAQYGRGPALIQNVATQLIGQFAECLRGQLSGAGLSAKQDDAAATSADAPPPSPPSAKPISGVALMFAVLRDAILGMFRRQG